MIAAILVILTTLCFLRRGGAGGGRGEVRFSRPLGFLVFWAVILLEFSQAFTWGFPKVGGPCFRNSHIKWLHPFSRLGFGGVFRAFSTGSRVFNRLATKEYNDTPGTITPRQERVSASLSKMRSSHRIAAAKQQTALNQYVKQHKNDSPSNWCSDFSPK